MSGPELDLHPEFNSRLLGLNLRQRFKVDPTWALTQSISENTKTSLNQQQGESERTKSRKPRVRRFLLNCKGGNSKVSKSFKKRKELKGIILKLLT